MPRPSPVLSPAAWTIAVAAAILLPPLLSFVGPPLISPRELSLGGSGAYIFSHLRLPRYTLAFLAGAALSLSGASFQALLKNPLADPYILGVSGGAALGSVAAVVLGLPFWALPAVGFVGALAAMALIRAFAGGAADPVTLLLTGVVFNSFSFALILLVNALAEFGESQQILFLLLGAVEPLPWTHIAPLAILVATTGGALLRRADKLDILSLGDEEAFHLGVDVARERMVVFLASSLLVGATVALCGLIGFVGLFVPQIARIILGASHRRLLPACLAGGGIFLTLSDFAAGRIFTAEGFHTRLPVGVVTALIGAPVFAWLLRRETGRHP